MENYTVHPGLLKLDGIEIPCYVVDDGISIERVLSQREVVKLITGGRESGNLKRYLEARALDGALQPDIKNNYDDNLLIFKAGSTSVNGVKASIVIDICNAYLKARQNGTLSPSQANLAEQSEIFISACAKTGIDAIIDEATGYQYFRKAHDLQERFRQYLQEEYREWTLTFPRQFFMQLYKLEGTTPPMPMKKYPKRFGKYVMHFVYDTLDPDIADFLRENNPEPGGKEHHHQLFNDFGYKSLTDHLMSVLGIMKASYNLERFNENLAIAFPNARTNRRGRLAKKRQNIPKDNKPQKPKNSNQTSLFDYLPSVNTPEEKLSGERHLTPFDKHLKGLLAVPPPKKGKDGAK